MLTFWSSFPVSQPKILGFNPWFGPIVYFCGIISKCNNRDSGDVPISLWFIVQTEAIYT